MDDKKTPQAPPGGTTPPNAPGDQAQSTGSTPQPPKNTPTPPPTTGSTPPASTQAAKTEPKPPGPGQPPPPNAGEATSPPPPQDHKSLPKWLLAVIFLFVLALLGVGAFAVYSNMTTPEPTPTPTLPQAQAPSPTQPAQTGQSILSDQLSLSFTIPQSWEHTSNITPEDITTTYGTGVTSPNEYASNNAGCSIYFGDVLGTEGPTQQLTNETITIDNTPFNKRSWYQEDPQQDTTATPFFMYLSGEDTTADIPSMWVWVPEDPTAQNCLDEVDQILTTVSFTEPASILPITPGNSSPSGEVSQCTADAKVCPDGSTVGRSGPNCQFDPCPPLVNQ